MQLLTDTEGEKRDVRDVLRFPVGMSDKEKLVWLQKKYSALLESRAFGKVKAERLRKYAEALELAIDYIQGVGNYRKLTDDAKRIVMFLLGCQRTWREYENALKNNEPVQKMNRDINRVLSLLRIDLLPEFRKEPVIKFLDYTKPLDEIWNSRPLEDWEIDALRDKKLNETMLMYKLGRPFEEILSLRSRINERRKENERLR